MGDYIKSGLLQTGQLKAVKLDLEAGCKRAKNAVCALKADDEVVMKVLGQGVYSISEVARLTGLNRARVYAWFNWKSQVTTQKSMFASDYHQGGRSALVSFYDLVDAFVACQLSASGIPTQSIRRVYTNLQKHFGEKHAFCRQEILTDGKEVFVHWGDDAGREFLIEVLEKQHVFPKIILPFLQKIDYVNSLASRLHIDHGVVVDPQNAFGQPVVENLGIQTHTLYQAFLANDKNLEKIADWYEVNPQDVLIAVQFEKKLAA